MIKAGRKEDHGKERYDLVPVMALQEMAKVLTFGAEKYGEYNWRHIDNLQDRYFAAAQRHLWAYRQGEINDEESGMHHLAHCLCCLFFMLEDDISGESAAKRQG